MESEKVKDIKKALECWQESVMLSTDENYVSHKVYNREILDYINELESENERLQNKNYKLEQNLGQCENGYKLELHTARFQLHTALEDLKKAQDRITELEKENTETMKEWFADREGVFWDGVGEGELKGYKQLKQFAEKVAKRLINIKGIKEILDETLKEFINKGDDN